MREWEGNHLKKTKDNAGENEIKFKCKKDKVE
jgi:hypothetical protein